MRYDPGTPGARLTTPEALWIELGLNQGGWANNARTIAMTRAADGTWQATVGFEGWWRFALFYLRDGQGRLDDNAGQYWEIVTCGADGTPTAAAVRFLAESWTGRQLRDGIHRDADYARALATLENDLSRHPERVGAMREIWLYRVKLAGETDAAWARLAADVDRFVDERRESLAAMEEAVQFASSFRTRVPAATLQKARAALVARDPASLVLVDLMYDDARAEKDPKARAARLAAFVESHPTHDLVQSALVERFSASAEAKDLPGAEAAFDAWRRFEPGVPDPYASMGRLYVDRAAAAERAIDLLGTAIGLCDPDAPAASTPQRGIRTRLWVSCDPPAPSNPAAGRAALEADRGRLRWYRGRAYVQAGQQALAIADLQAAARALPDDWEVAFALGQACEAAGRTEDAVRAYLAAASAPHQASRAPGDALARLFVAGGLGTKAELDACVEAAVAVRRKQVASDFTPVPVDRAAPPFDLTTLDGRRLSNASLRGRPVVLTFWATWCAPCLGEMPGFIELQRRNPGVAVVAVAIESQAADVLATVATRGLAALHVALSDAAGLAYGAAAIPRTCVLDAGGRLRFVHEGALDDVVAILEKELAMLAAR